MTGQNLRQHQLWLKTAVWALQFCVNFPRWKDSQDNWLGTATIIHLCACWQVILHNVSSLLQGLTYACLVQAHKVSPRDHKPLPSKLYAQARHQCGVTGLPHSLWALPCCSEQGEGFTLAAARPTSPGVHTYLSKCWINGKKKCPATELNSFGLEASSTRDLPCPREKWNLDTRCSIWVFHFTGHCQDYRFLADIPLSAAACLCTYGY